MQLRFFIDVGPKYIIKFQHLQKRRSCWRNLLLLVHEPSFAILRVPNPSLQALSRIFPFLEQPPEAENDMASDPIRQKRRYNKAGASRSMSDLIVAKTLRTSGISGRKHLISYLRFCFKLALQLCDLRRRRSGLSLGLSPILGFGFGLSADVGASVGIGFTFGSGKVGWCQC